MIICRECGTSNDDSAEFCDGCPAFLEWSGDRVAEAKPLPPPATPPVENRPGIIRRVKDAITGDNLPLPQPVDESVPPLTAEPTHLPPPIPPHPASPLVARPVDQVPQRRRTADGEGRPSAAPGTPMPAPPGSADGETVTPTDTGPAPQIPSTRKVRPAPVVPPASRSFKPGDVICGQCGEGNGEQRNFCRKCGEPLADAPMVTRPPWYRRIFRRKPKGPVAAGERLGRGSGSGSGSIRERRTRQARLARGRVLGKMASLRRIMALLAMAGIGVGFALPNVRTTMMDKGNDVLSWVRSATDDPTAIPIDADRVSASSESAETPASNGADGDTASHWIPQPSDDRPTLSIELVEPTDLVVILVFPGIQEDRKINRDEPFPRDIVIQVTDEEGAVRSFDKRLENVDGFQTVDAKVDDAVSIEVEVLNCFPDLESTTCAITDVEPQFRS